MCLDHRVRVLRRDDLLLRREARVSFWARLRFWGCVGCNIGESVERLFADETFTPSAHVIGGTTSTSLPLPILQFVDVATVWTLFVSVADRWDVEALPLQVVVVALVSEEFSVAQPADRGGCGKLATC